jgi:hypothetical protein
MNASPCALQPARVPRSDTAGRRSLLADLRSQYEAAHAATQANDRVESFEAIDARMRKAFRWLEQAVTYLNELKPAIDHRFDLGYGYAFDSPRFARGSVGQHARRIAGFPVLETIDVYYEISASKPLAIEVATGWVPFAEKTLDAFGLQHTRRNAEEAGAGPHKTIFSVAPVIPARVSFRIDHRTGVVAVDLANVDRLERITLELSATAIDETALEDLLRLMLGLDSAFLRRAPLARRVAGPPAA